MADHAAQPETLGTRSNRIAGVESFLHRFDLRHWNPGEPVSAETVLQFGEPAGGLKGSCLLSAPADSTVAWFEIGAADVDAAKAFYGQLFGWSFAPDGAYTLITAPGSAGPSGGIFNTGGNIPPYAVFVVQVADVAASAARTEELGGTVVVAPMKLEDGMVVAYLTDPHGSMFALFSPKPDS